MFGFLTLSAVLLVAVGGLLVAGADDHPQLVEKCGRAQPSSIFFPTSRRGRARRSAFSLKPILKHPKTGVDIVHPFVVGGQPVERQEGVWPWIVLLGERKGGSVDWFCGGTLISARTVLTAAHCLTGKRAYTLTARLGEHDTTTTSDGQHTDAYVSKIIIHPQYSSRENDNDIALLRLSRPVRFSPLIQPACLPEDDDEHIGEEVKLGGWGAIEFLHSSQAVLHEVELTVVGEHQCELQYADAPAFRDTFPSGFHDTKMCAESPDDTPKDACTGDSGGPLMYVGNDGLYQVVGIVSTGVGCGNPKYPGVYTRVSKYRSWIFNNSV